MASGGKSSNMVASTCCLEIVDGIATETKKMMQLNYNDEHNQNLQLDSTTDTNSTKPI